jgi:hypothetical protein
MGALGYYSDLVILDVMRRSSRDTETGCAERIHRILRPF